MTRPAAFLLFAVLGTLGAAREARACSCEAIDLERSFTGSELVLEADVVDTVERPGNELRATLQVTRVFKGRAPAQLVYDGEDGNLCGMSFRASEHYVVYGRIEGGLLATSYCNGTTSGDAARVAIAWLEEHATAQPPEAATPTPAGTPAFAHPEPFPEAAPDDAAGKRGCAASSRDKAAPLAPACMLPLLAARRRRTRR